MKQSVNSNYALALFSIAKEDNSIKKYYKEIKEISAIFENNLEIVNLLKSEFLSLQDRYDCLDKIFKRKYSLVVINFIKVLIKNHHLNSYQRIFDEFISLCNKENNILEGIIYSTYKLKDEEIHQIELALKKKNKQGIMLTNKIDPSLIGGIKVIIDNHIYDYSIANELSTIKSKLKA